MGWIVSNCRCFWCDWGRGWGYGWWVGVGFRISCNDCRVLWDVRSVNVLEVGCSCMSIVIRVWLRGDIVYDMCYELSIFVVIVGICVVFVISFVYLSV